MTKTLFQHSTIGALMDGMFEGTFPIEDLLQKGNMGIGTFHGLDGELVLIDGTAYQIKVDGAVLETNLPKHIPYAAVTHFDGENTLEITTHHTKDEFQDKMVEAFATENTFQAIQVTGTFNNMFCRSVAQQEEPYPRLVEVAKDQAEFRQETVEGTLVGFYTPKAYGTIAVPGFHLHFLSNNKDYGGHVLEFEINQAEVEWDTIETLEQHFPLRNETFMRSEIDYSRLEKDIAEAE